MQALAMRITIEQLGHEVYYVDYWPEYHQRAYSIFNKDTFNSANWKGKIVYLLKTIKHAPYVKRRRKNFESFHDKYTLPYCKPLTEKYDVIVYGSDQIWRKQKGLNDYNPIYFAQNDFSARMHVAFSASMGMLPDNDSDKEKVRQLVSHFNKIAVRENNLKALLKELGFEGVVQSLDPTLLVDSKIWDEKLPTVSYTGKKYILVYVLWGDVFNWDSIRALANKEGLMIRVLKGDATHADTETEITTAGPDAFINLIKNAEYIFSSSFHGVAFSLIYNKQFFASFKTNGGRAQSLLESVGIPERYLDNCQPISSDVKMIDYGMVNERLSDWRSQSINFLKTL